MKWSVRGGYWLQAAALGMAESTQPVTVQLADESAVALCVSCPRCSVQQAEAAASKLSAQMAPHGPATRQLLRDWMSDADGPVPGYTLAHSGASVECAWSRWLASGWCEVLSCHMSATDQQISGVSPVTALIL